MASFLSGLATAFLPQIKEGIGKIGGELIEVAGNAFTNKVQKEAQNRFGVNLNQGGRLDLSQRVDTLTQRVNNLSNMMNQMNQDFQLGYSTIQ